MLISTKYAYAVIDVDGYVLAHTTNRSDARYIKQDAEDRSYYKACGFKQPFKIVRYSNPEVIR